MKDNLKILDENQTEIQAVKKESAQILSLTAFQIIICFVILSLCFLLKSKNLKLFNELSSWYQDKICYESITYERIYKEFTSVSSFVISYFDKLYSSFKK